MPADIIQPESEFVAAVMNAAEFYFNSPIRMHREPAKWPAGSNEFLKDPKAIAKIVNALFWTSLAAEEGRPVRGSVALCSPFDSNPARHLDEGQPVTIRSLTSLMAASPESPIGVSDHTGEMTAWGFLEYPPMMLPLLRIVGPGILLPVCFLMSSHSFRKGKSAFFANTSTAKALVR